MPTPKFFIQTTLDTERLSTEELEEEYRDVMDSNAFPDLARTVQPPAAGEEPASDSELFERAKEYAPEMQDVMKSMFGDA